MVKTFEKYTSVALLCMSLSLFSCAGVPGKSSAHTNVSDSEQKTVNKNGKTLLLVHKGSNMSQEHRADHLNEYMQTLQNIVFKAQNIPDETQNGKAFSSAFTALITDTNGKALANENISVKYPSGWFVLTHLFPIFRAMHNCCFILPLQQWKKKCSNMPNNMRCNSLLKSVPIKGLLPYP